MITSWVALLPPRLGQWWAIHVLGRVGYASYASISINGNLFAHVPTSKSALKGDGMEIQTSRSSTFGDNIKMVI